MLILIWAAHPISACGVINTSGEYYLTGDLEANDTCLIVNAPITLDGRGHIIQGVKGNGTGIVINAPNVEIKYLSIKDMTYGIYVNGSNGFVIEGVKIYDPLAGIYTDHSSGKIEDVYVTEGKNGMICNYSRDIHISQITIKGGQKYSAQSYGMYCENSLLLKAEDVSISQTYIGILAKNTSRSTWADIKVAATDAGILVSNGEQNLFDEMELWDSTYGMKIQYSHYNTITNSHIHDNTYGFDIRGSSHLNITHNHIIRNVWGMAVGQFEDETVYDNVFNNTLSNIQGLGSYPYNVWNTSKTPGPNIMDGPYIGGNAWLKPDGTGFSEICNDTNGDGFCDEPHRLNAYNVDYLPLAVRVSGPTLSLEFVPPTPYGFQNTTNHTFRLEANMPVSSCWLELDGTNHSMIIEDSTHYTITLNLSEGNHTFKGYCDGISTSPEWVLVDTVPPSIRVIRPASSHEYDSPVTFRFQSHDDWSPQIYCTMYVDGSVYRATLSNSSTYSRSISLSSGTHRWMIRCRDEAGNSNTTQYISFRVNKEESHHHPSPPSTTGRLEVSVDDIHLGDSAVIVVEADGRPVRGAHVRVVQNHTVVFKGSTNSYGIVAFTPVSSGWYDALASHPSYEDGHAYFYVENARPHIQLSMNATNTTVMCSLNYTDDGHSTLHVVIKYGNKTMLNTTMNLIGSYYRKWTMYKHAGLWMCEVSAHDEEFYEVANISLYINESNGTSHLEEPTHNQTYDIRIIKERGNYVNDTVIIKVLVNHRPAANVTVVVSGANGSFQQHFITNQTGEIAFVPQGDGEYNVTAYYKGNNARMRFRIRPIEKSSSSPLDQVCLCLGPLGLLGLVILVLKGGEEPVDE